MSLLNSHPVPNYTKIFVFLLAFFLQVTVRAWDIDLSRRQKDLYQAKGPGLVAEEPNPENIINSVFEAIGPQQEIVILHTDQGFVPSTIQLKKGGTYKFHVVNVNEKEKNVSFILDAFSEHYGTYFGKPKSFVITPKAEGVFSFQCPETAKQGKIVILKDGARKPASE